MKKFKLLFKAAAILFLIAVFSNTLSTAENTDPPKSPEKNMTINLGMFKFAFSYMGDYVEKRRIGQVWKIQDYGKDDFRGYGDNDMICVLNDCKADELLAGYEILENSFSFKSVKYVFDSDKRKKGIFSVSVILSSDMQMIEYITIHFTQDESYTPGEKKFYSITAKNLKRKDSYAENAMMFWFVKGTSHIENVELSVTGNDLDIRNTTVVSEEPGFIVEIWDKEK